MTAKLTGAALVDAIARFAAKYSIETTPKESARIGNYGEHLSPGQRIYIAHIAGSPYNELITLAARLRKEGFEPVMHVTARDMPNKATLDDVIARYTGEAGGKQVLLIGGDMPSPTGDFADTITILRTGVFERHGIASVGLAGHPEGSKAIGEPRLSEALKAKNDYARQTNLKLRIVTQFGFEAQPFIDWERNIRESGLNALEIYVGMPGLASFPTLLRFAVECGAGPSIRASALTRRQPRQARDGGSAGRSLAGYRRALRDNAGEPDRRTALLPVRRRQEDRRMAEGRSGEAH